MRHLPLLLAAAVTTVLAIEPGSYIFYGSTVPECMECATIMTEACGPSLTWTPQHASCLCSSSGQDAIEICIDVCVNAASSRGLLDLKPERTMAREWLYYCIPFHPEVYCTGRYKIPTSLMSTQEQAKVCAEANSAQQQQPSTTTGGKTATPPSATKAATDDEDTEADTSAGTARQVPPAWALVAGLALVPGLI